MALGCPIVSIDLRKMVPYNKVAAHPTKVDCNARRERLRVHSPGCVGQTGAPRSLCET